jgi:hypothetical protein
VTGYSCGLRGAGPLYRDNAARPLTMTAFEALVALDRGLRTISATDC